MILSVAIIHTNLCKTNWFLLSLAAKFSKKKVELLIYIIRVIGTSSNGNGQNIFAYDYISYNKIYTILLHVLKSISYSRENKTW